MAQTVLLTGFEPFGGSEVNPSAEIAHALVKQEIIRLTVRASILPVVWVPCRLSNSAGTFLCNEVFFATLHYLSARTPSIPVGFVHVPPLPEQVAREDRPGPSMGLETMLRGARALLEAVAEVVAPPPSDGRPATSRQRVGLPTE